MYTYVTDKEILEVPQSFNSRGGGGVGILYCIDVQMQLPGGS